MSIYVVSDIHNRYSELKSLLEHISFNENDRLIIAGDAIDRGPSPYEIVKFIMENENVDLLLGNHEELFMGTMIHDLEKYRNRRIWFANGGAKTHKALLHYKIEQKFYEYLCNCEKSIQIDNYFISHSGNGEDTWDREIYHNALEGIEPEREEDKVLIIGHCPVHEENYLKDALLLDQKIINLDSNRLKSKGISCLDIENKRFIYKLNDKYESLDINI